MNELSFMEKLLDGVEVEWKALGAVLVRTKGTKITAGQMKVLHKKGAPVKIFAGGKTVAFVDFEDIPAKGINRKPSVIVKSRGVIEFEYYDKPFSHKNEMWSYHANSDYIHIKFLYHFLKLNEPHFQQLGSKMQMPQIATPDTDKFLVPIPCPDNPKKSLEIQAEIVRILDAFTAMTAELTAELNLRKKQYNYYRDQLLSFEDGTTKDTKSTKNVEVEWKTLGDEDFFEVGSGGTPSKSKHEYWDNGNIPWLKSESCNNEPVYFANNFITEIGLAKSSAKLLKEKTTLIALVGATIFKTAFLEFSAATNQNIASIKSKKPDAVNDKFVFYYITNLYEVLKSEMRNYGMLNLTTLRQFKIPIPPPEEQSRIVAILDKFDTLTNSITEGLPREIELRQKQYEYYRNLLLSFPQPQTDHQGGMQ